MRKNLIIGLGTERCEHTDDSEGHCTGHTDRNNGYSETIRSGYREHTDHY